MDRERERERLGERTGYDQGWKSSDRDREQQREHRDRDKESGFQGGPYVSGGRDRSQQDYNQPHFQSGGAGQQQQQQYGAESRQDFTRYSPYDNLRGGLGGLGDQQKYHQWHQERYPTSGSGFGYGQESRYPVLGGGIQYQQYPSHFGGSGAGFSGNLPGGYPENVSFGQSGLPSRSYYSGGFRETPYLGGAAAGAGGREWAYGSRLGQGQGEQELLGSYGSQGLSSGLGYSGYEAGQSPQYRGYQQQQQQLYKHQCRFAGKESCDINLAEASGVFYPNVDIYEDRNNMYLDFELPGIKREDVFLHIAGAEDHRVLNVSGVVRDKPERLDARYLQKNRKTGRFKLKIHLPDNIRTEEITADLTDGILTATIPKTEEVSSGFQAGVRKRIDITSRLPQYKSTGAGTTQEKFGEAERPQGAAPQQAQVTPQPPQLGQTAQQQQQVYRPGYSSQT